MRRKLLGTTMALGLVVTAMGFTGIYAVFTDRATTGTNNAESGSQARIADLKIATTVSTDCTDGSYVDDLATGVITATDLLPGGGTGFTVVCLRNDGTATLNLMVTAIDVLEAETACTGDEAAAGDTTCGTGDPGELGAALLVVASRLDCVTSTTDLSFSKTITALTGPGAAESLGSLGAGDTACIWIRVQMLTAGQSGTTLEDIQQAQSDRVEWRFAFDGTQA